MATAKKKARSGASESKLPCVLVVGGLDPGGGAGVLADARAILRAGAFPTAALAVLTVQSTSGMRSATPVAKTELLAECMEVVKHQRVRAIKVGALGGGDNAAAIGDFLAVHRDLPSVVDTVMVPTRGRARLLEERGVTMLRERVIGHATLVTANAPEAEVLTGRRVTRLDEAHAAVHALLALGVRAVLLKGGHLGGVEAVDLLGLAAASKGRSPRVVALTAKRLKVPAFHGGGCVLASLIAGRLAVRETAYRENAAAAILDTVRWSKKVHHAALKTLVDVGGDLRVLLL